MSRPSDLRILGDRPVHIYHPGAHDHEQESWAELTLATPKGTLRRVRLDLPELLALAASAAEAARLVEKVNRERPEREAEAEARRAADNERWRRAADEARKGGML